MTVLDRDAFKMTVTTKALRIPFLSVKEVTTQLENELLNLPRIRSVVNDNSSSETKLVLLRLDFDEIRNSLSSDKLKYIEEHDIVPYSFDVGYDYWTAEQILYSVMPEGDAETPSSYTTTGHIAHVNLKEENQPFKQLIAQVILDKNKKIKSVVNKTNNIDNTYRNFEMEILAGDDNMITELRENECRFKFDFSKVYWNSRLQAEHRRLVQLFKKGEYVCDVMAGVGPFSIPAAKKGALVYSNDLNPESYKWLCENVRLNKITNKDAIKMYNMDGRAFIKQAIHDLSVESNGTRFFQHFVMNLPATAIEFLDAFKGIYKDVDISSDSLPMIHCHCFTRSSDPIADINQRVCQIMGGPIDSAKMHWVRTVAPKKDMYCVSFRLSPEVAFLKQ